MKRRVGGMSFYIILLILLIAVTRWINPPSEAIPEEKYDRLVQTVDQGKVKEISLKRREVTVKTQDGKSFTAIVPEAMIGDLQDHVSKAMTENPQMEVQGFKDDNSALWWQVVPYVILLLMMVGFWYMMFQGSSGGGGRMMNFGKSKAKMIQQEDKTRVTFADVAGLMEEKEELAEIVDFLKNPKKYVKMGARIPKGVLMVGPPGTGKTYLSRAVAGEAGVPFFTMSGSDFVEMFVGVGASRVRDLFESAKKSAPCIVFIDEIDAVGRRRGAGLGGGHDEREQTLNQLLVEMDGFGTNEGVIVMAATNRADILDPALLRPGRFDRTVFVGRPDVKGREAILAIHSRKKPLSPLVDLRDIARQTPGFTPADLENLMNEAALLAARENSVEITKAHIEEAALKVEAGPAKKSKVVTEKERKLTAVHEAGHAVVSRSLEGHDPVHMITIIPRGNAGGFTAYLPENDVNFETKSGLIQKLVSLLGGRVAEALVLDDISTGAGNDIERATAIARAMVTQFGMSEKLGTLTYGADDNNTFLGRDLGRTQHYSEKVASQIDEEMRKLVGEAYEKAEQILTEKMDVLLALSDALLERETLDRDEFELIYNGGTLAPEKDPDGNPDEKIEEKDLSDKAMKIVEDQGIDPENPLPDQSPEQDRKDLL